MDAPLNTLGVNTFGANTAQEAKLQGRK